MTTLSYIPPEMTTLAAVRSGRSLLLSSWPTHSDMVLAGSMEGALGGKKPANEMCKTHSLWNRHVIKNSPCHGITMSHPVAECYQLNYRGIHRTHTPCRTSTGYISAATIDVTSLPMCIEQVLSRILCLCIQGVGVTTYRIYNNVHIVKLKRWAKC